MSHPFGSKIHRKNIKHTKLRREKYKENFMFSLLLLFNVSPFCDFTLSIISNRKRFSANCTGKRFYMFFGSGCLPNRARFLYCTLLLYGYTKVYGAHNFKILERHTVQYEYILRIFPSSAWYV